MTKRPDPVFNSSAAQSIGIMVALLIIIPQLMRIADGRQNGFDLALLIAGGLLAVAWLVIIVVGARRRLGSRQ